MQTKQVFKHYTFSFYRSARGGEIGPQLEQEQRACKNKTDAIKTGKLIAKQAGWRLMNIDDLAGNNVFN